MAERTLEYLVEEIKAEREIAKGARESIEKLKTEAIKRFSDYQVGDVINNDSGYNGGLWLIRNIVIDDDLEMNRFGHVLKCVKIKNDGTVGERHADIRTNNSESLDNLGKYEEWKAKQG